MTPSTDRLRLLMVGTDDSWLRLVRDSAARIGAELDVVSDVGTAVTWMLRPGRVYDQVLASFPVGPRGIDTLTGMLDEVTLRPTPLLLLGCVAPSGDSGVRYLPTADQAALCEALRRPASPTTPRPVLTDEELIGALHGGGLRMRFQPILRASDLKPIGLEALARIHTLRHGILHPKDFIPVTVACGRERVLTNIAASRTFLELGRQPDDGALFVSINLPLTTMLSDQALERALELCAAAGVQPSRIMLEVLETPIVPDFGQLRTALERWRHHGFVTAIDDAGPALPHWRDMVDLPFDVLKIDGALVANPAEGDLLQAIVAAAKARGRFIIAEGIEDEACLARIRPLAVDAVQGFLFARPLPALAVVPWLQHWGSDPEARSLAEAGTGLAA